MAFVLTRLLVSYFEAISAHDQMVLTEDVLFDTSFTQLWSKNLHAKRLPKQKELNSKERSSDVTWHKM